MSPKVGGTHASPPGPGVDAAGDAEFRDTLLKHLSTLPPGDLDAVSAKLEALGNQLDFRKYEGPLFELLLVGALLAPGGSYVEDGAERSPFSILTSTKHPVETADMKKHVDVFNRLIRRCVHRRPSQRILVLTLCRMSRYKYLQKLFEENALTEILQYANKWKGEDLDKLTFATALFISTGLASPNVLLTLKKENLVRDGTQSEATIRRFLTVFVRRSVPGLLDQGLPGLPHCRVGRSPFELVAPRWRHQDRRLLPASEE